LDLWEKAGVRPLFQEHFTILSRVLGNAPMLQIYLPVVIKSIEIDVFPAKPGPDIVINARIHVIGKDPAGTTRFFKIYQIF
jgi:hypothetical protein